MTYIMAFLIPVVIWVISIAISGIFPFGGNTVFTSDMAYQYAGYFEFVQKVLTEGVNPTFSFFKGIGEETLGMLVYYMMSPFNLILALFPKANITEGVLVINLLKIGLSGVTFSLFVKKEFKKSNNVAVVAFSTCYALMAYNIAYQFNIMWIDAVVWLPVIILGIDRLIEKNKSDVFFTGLTVSILSNWYIGFMLCVFSAFWFIYRTVKKGFSKRAFLKFMLCGVLSAGTALIVILPAVYTCMAEVKRSNLLDSSLINYTLLDIFSKFIIGGFDFWQITDKSASAECLNLPNLFAGATTFMLFVMYFFNDSFSKKEKIQDGVFFLVLLAFTVFAPLNRIWHVFTYNIWFPYRYSFCISFYMIYIAYKSLSGISGISLKNVLYILVALIIGCFIVEKQNYTYITSELIYCTIFMLCTGFISIKLVKAGNKSAFGFLVLVISVEMFTNTAVYMLNFDFFDRNTFYSGRAIVNEKISEIKEKDNGYYRIENSLIKDYNANIGQEILGITSSSTMGKESTRGLLESLGFTRVVCNSVIYSPVTRFADSFLGVKYYISDTTKKNDDALSLGFLVDDSVTELKDFITPWTQHSNSFEKMNELAKKSSKIDEDIYSKLEIFDVKKENLKETLESNVYEKVYPYSKALYSFSFYVPNGNDIYLKIDGGAVNNAILYVNDKEIGKYMTSQEYSTLKIGNFNENEKVKVDIEFVDSNKVKLNNVWIYSENDDIYKKVINELKRSQLEIDDMTSSSLIGRIKVEDDGKILLFTVPYDKYLRVFVDNKPTNTRCVLDSLLAVDLGKGEHIITVYYYPEYLLKVGIISVVFLAFGIIFICMEHRKGIKNEK